MTRGEGIQNKVHFRGETNDFVVFVESPELLDEWRQDPASVTLPTLVNGWKVFTTERGNHMRLFSAPTGQLDSEFGTHDLLLVIDQILTRGTLIHNHTRGRLPE